MLVIHDQDHFNNVVAFALRRNLIPQLCRVLERLGNYGAREGGRWDRKIGGHVECHLGEDRHAPHSFAFRVDCRLPGETETNHRMFGGLIYQGPTDEGEQVCDGTSPTLTVSLATGAGWFSHT